MEKEHILLLAEQVVQNVLKESNTSGDVGQFGKLIQPLIERMYLESLVVQIADTQPVKSPVDKIAALFSVYSGDGSSAETNTHPDSSFIIVCDPAAATATMNVGDVITEDGTGATYTVAYLEGDKVLVARTTGTHDVVRGDSFNSGAFTASYASLNRASIKKLFRNYTGSYAYGNDDNSVVKALGFETKTFKIEVKSRKIRSKFSYEQIYDLMKIYNEKGIDVAAKYLANEVQQEIDKEFISFLKYISSFSANTITLSNSMAKTNSLVDVTNDLILNILLAAEGIVRATKRNRRIFVMADPITTAFLQLNPWHTVTEGQTSNPYRVGNICTYPLFCDLYAEPGEYYCMVGYQGSTKSDGDSGIFFAPYTNKVIPTESGDMKHELLFMNRYALVRHPQDTGNKDSGDIWSPENASNSDFFKMFTVDYGSGLPNFTDTSIPFFSET